MRLAVLATAALLAVSLGAAGGEATPTQSTKLHARVGPGFSISLSTADGTRVTKLDPGNYEIEVEDESDEHNFHLLGPGVDRATDVVGMGKELWTVTLRDGAYRYVCDPHSVSMRGAFTVGDVPTAPPPATGAPLTPKTKLKLTSGPGFTITLKTSAGKTVTSLRTGTYTVTVQDRSGIHNAHVVAPGYNRLTKPLGYTGSQTWKVKLAKTGTLRFLCDPHASQGMKGSAKIVR